MMNLPTKSLGGLAQSLCTSYFLTQGYIVSQPLYDNAKYDLIVDNGTVLKRVQCKYSTSTRSVNAGRRSYPTVNLHNGSKTPGRHDQYYTLQDFDLLWVMTANAFYLIPTEEIFKTGQSKDALRLYPRWNQFIVDFPHPSGNEALERQAIARLSEPEKTRIIQLFQTGLSTPAIASQMGLTMKCVSGFLLRAGLHYKTP